jgi:hypothetical protein
MIKLLVGLALGIWIGMEFTDEVKSLIQMFQPAINDLKS